MDTKINCPASFASSTARSHSAFTKDFLSSVGIKLVDCSFWGTMPKGWYKVAEDTPSSYQFCGLFNPETMEYTRVLEWDYEDCRVDANPYRYLSIDVESEAFGIWWNLVFPNAYAKVHEAEELKRLAEEAMPKVGDMVRVVKGRTLPKGTEGKVIRVFNYRASYYNVVTYCVLESGEKINIANVVKF